MAVFIYILYSASEDSFYIGQSENPWRRLKEHRRHRNNTYTSKASDWIMKAIFAIVGSRKTACHIEQFIKRQKSRRFLLKIMEKDWVAKGELKVMKRVY
ncbi:MAG: GIY-YIG nuclease family protein [Bacteroidota bacterium]|nr:GIY-YIG nuclease family protein [Bacteroidota bacterium]MDX5447572.1 GIY-YIG nuclease family protein [Bacteroidota bacterium]MDX5506134.1 GIY-YIG nuclease family protein [Bacteroidota bacterium]